MIAVAAEWGVHRGLFLGLECLEVHVVSAMDTSELLHAIEVCTVVIAHLNRSTPSSLPLDAPLFMAPPSKALSKLKKDEGDRGPVSMKDCIVCTVCWVQGECSEW